MDKLSTALQPVIWQEKGRIEYKLRKYAGLMRDLHIKLDKEQDEMENCGIALGLSFSVTDLHISVTLDDSLDQEIYIYKDTNDPKSSLMATWVDAFGFVILALTDEYGAGGIAKEMIMQLEILLDNKGVCHENTEWSWQTKHPW